MTIGLVIPTFNEEQTLPHTLETATQLQIDEIVVVDGGSQDRTLQVAQSFFERPLLYHTHTLVSTPGRATQMNMGAMVTQTDILVFLHADTQLPINARTAIEQAMADTRIHWGRFDVQFETDRGWAWVISRMMNFRSRWSRMATGDQAIFIRRSIFQQLGGFANIPIMEDLELSRRLKKAGEMAALRDKVTTSFRRWEQQGPLRTILLMWTLRFLYWVGLAPRALQRFYGMVR
ncbi:MAG: glycosyltransferase [Nitrospirales bacterium]|nr:glycosyltransferase [Nitrospirales bacterium]